MGDQLRIAIFTNTFIPDVNGVANAVNTFRQELLRRGHAVYVFAPAPKHEGVGGDDPLVFRFPSVQIFDLDYQAAFPFSMTAQRALRGVNFDLVHTHHPLWVGEWGRMFAKSHKLPLITTVHTHYELFAQFVPLPPKLVKEYLRRKTRRYCQKCDLVTTPGASTARRLQRLGVTKPLMVLPNGVDLSRLETATGQVVRDMYGLGDKFIMGYLGRLSPEKQVDVVIKAAARVFAKEPNSHLLIVGDGYSRSELEAQVTEMGLKSKVTFAGSVAYSRVHEYHAAFDVLLSASRGDTMPLAYAETMAAGTPVIAAMGFGALDMIVDGLNGYLISRTYAETQLADRVMTLLENPGLLKEMAQNAREWSRQYRVDVATDRLLQCYDLGMRVARGEEVELEPPVKWPGVGR